MTEIPNAFGGFAPFPNTIMIPTMGLQSDVIGYRFGFGYEKGKRTLRAMSNEEFNNLDDAEEAAIFKRHDSAAINYFRTEMVNWVELQKLIIEKSVEIEVMKAIRTPSAFREMFEGFTKGFSDQQKQDAGKFFGGLKDTIMQMMSWFSGHKPSSAISSSVQEPFTSQQPFSPANPTPFTPIVEPVVPTSSSKVPEQTVLRLWTVDVNNSKLVGVVVSLTLKELSDLRLNYLRAKRTFQEQTGNPKALDLANKLAYNVTIVSRVIQKLR